MLLEGLRTGMWISIDVYEDAKRLLWDYDRGGVATTYGGYQLILQNKSIRHN
jgi:hypothetical protein